MTKNKDCKPETFLDWIIGLFGDYMNDEYLIFYNKKIWKRPLDKMAADWVFTPGRLPFPYIEAINILKENDIISVGRWGSWHYWNTDMVYRAILMLKDWR